MNDRKFVTLNTVLLATAVGTTLVVCWSVVRHRAAHKLWKRIFATNPLMNKRIEIIETIDDCHRVVDLLKKHCESYKVLGFDCEWVTVGGSRRPIALLQLSSHNGLCALFRLCCLKRIPKSLRDLLEDEKVIKIGVGPQDDAGKLSFDYGVGVASTLDLRYLADKVGRKAEGLAKMSKSLLGVTLDKNWRLSCSDWEAKNLNEKQIDYAANDAVVAIEIFKKLAKELEPSKFWRSFEPSLVLQRMEPFFDVSFKDGFLQNSNTLKVQKSSTLCNNKGSHWQAKKDQTRKISTRAKVLYDNCLLEAPDGETLCTIDRKKANWYVQQNLGVEMKAEPLTVRLNFEPAGRAVGEVGRYYQSVKQNRCVVCGRSDAYLRKNVIPREYRKHFPDMMKSHTSHDVLLLCPNCHKMSNISDLKMRAKLAKLCDAPFSHAKLIEVPDLRKVKNAARALLLNNDKLPDERRESLKKIVLEYFVNDDDLTPELLKQAANVESTLPNEAYCQHGDKVVEKFKTSEFGGLIELERMWREHFLSTMKPKHMPLLWNVNHNANRLEIRAQEGRVSEQDLTVAGVKQTNFFVPDKFEID